MMDKPRSETNSGKRSRWGRAVKLGLILGGLLLVALLGLLLGIGLYEGLRPLNPPSADLASVEEFLAAQAPTAHHRPDTDSPTTATAKSEAVSRYSLLKEPPQPEPDWPVKKDIVDKRVAAVVEGLRDYLRNRDHLDVNDTLHAFALIDSDFWQLNVSIEWLHPVRRNWGRQWVDQERLAELARAVDQAHTEGFARLGRWVLAAHYYESDHSTMTPQEAWDREVYYLRRLGGAEGYGRITGRFLERKYQAFYERLGRNPKAKALQKTLPKRLDLN